MRRILIVIVLVLVMLGGCSRSMSGVDGHSGATKKGASQDKSRNKADFTLVCSGVLLISRMYRRKYKHKQITYDAFV